MTTSRDEIVAKRQARIAEIGHAEGADVPRRREAAITPFLGENGLICEIKRRSQTGGSTAPDLDAVEQAGLFIKAGARNLSVLSEPNALGGRLEDLIRVKKAFPRAAVLRRDFLLDPHDIDISWRAGADAVSLVAGILSQDRLTVLYRCAKSLGLEVLLEIHDAGDLAKAAKLAPELLGVDSRDPVGLRIDPLSPLRVKAGVDWDCRLVYESGVSSPEQAAFAASSGFYGLLVGEAAMRNPDLAGQILEAMRAAPAARFWPEIGRKLAEGRTLVKVCGLTREDDARLAADLGADALGFNFRPESRRRAGPALVRALRDVGIPKIAVAASAAGAESLDPAVLSLLENGLLDAVQMHGGEAPDDCSRLWHTYYKALRPDGVAELTAAGDFRCPRVLLGATGKTPGGAGKRVGPEILEAWDGPLWLAGGITPENAGRIASSRRPELLDVVGGVEDSPGIKNRDKMKKLIKDIKEL